MAQRRGAEAICLLREKVGLSKSIYVTDAEREEFAKRIKEKQASGLSQKVCKLEIAKQNGEE